MARFILASPSIFRQYHNQGHYSIGPGSDGMHERAKLVKLLYKIRAYQYYHI